MISERHNVLGDLDLDGDVDSTDKATAESDFKGTTLGRGVLSAVGNRAGYAGYLHDPSATELAHVRRRVLSTVLGRWISRDPAQYVDGVNLVLYGRSLPQVLVDPTGLMSTRGVPTLCYPRCSEIPRRPWTEYRGHPYILGNLGVEESPNFPAVPGQCSTDTPCLPKCRVKLRYWSELKQRYRVITEPDDEQLQLEEQRVWLLWHGVGGTYPDTRGARKIRWKQRGQIWISVNQPLWRDKYASEGTLGRGPNSGLVDCGGEHVGTVTITARRDPDMPVQLIGPRPKAGMGIRLSCGGCTRLRPAQ